MTEATGIDAKMPPAKPSDEADQNQLKMAKEEGAKYLASLDYMAEKVADTGGKMRAGDYIVAFAQERAEGMFHRKDGKLEWIEAPSDMNCHMEIAVLDAADHRFIPYLDIDCTLSLEGQEIVRFKPEFLWHPGLYHYGRDLKLPGDGVYDLSVKIAPPTFPRHDEKNGKRYADPVEVTFEKIRIETGHE
ncbi:Fe2+ transport protein [Fulvimarina manganoxydans]|uniref:Fe2+ transport protein n=1 Tax=Fulvimarina manganoxydans TaxID=937218 RepID=A0A1W2C1P5_9HYPH|nr:iron transporter [Fulvimarina manganoxydans]SMC79070.1 Fe2+ transport protein [Fulvimarina manganoxydans]